MTDHQASASDDVVTWSNVEYYIKNGLDATFRMNGRKEPRIDYVIAGGDIELHVGLARHQHAPTSNFPMIQIEEAKSGGARIARLRTVDQALLRDFHDLICAIADRMVRGGRQLDRALSETVRAWNALLRGPRALAHQKRIGLLGELVILRALSEDELIGWSSAAEAWVGVAEEEHDFALADFDVEVKTTSSTKPLHTIHGASQLTPKPGRPLWLASLQVTRGGNAGITLTELAALVREELAKHVPERLSILNDALSAAGWEAGALDDERWIMSSPPQVFAVNDDFPRIDESFFASLSPLNRVRIDQISYRVDLTAITPDADAPIALSAAQFPSIERVRPS